MGAAGGPVKVERDGGEYQPGAVGGEVPGRQVRQRPGFEVGVDLPDRSRGGGPSWPEPGGALSVNIAW